MPTVDTTPGDEERLFTGYAGRLSMLISMGWLTVLLGRNALPPLLPSIISDFSMTSTQAGLGMTVMWAIYALMQFPAGQFSDDISRTRILQIAFVSAVLGFILLLVVSSFSGFLIAIGLLGFGAGMYFTPARALVSDLFTEKRGQVLGIHSAAGMVGSALAAGLAVAALSVGRWQLAFLPVVPLLVFEWGLLTRWSQESHGSYNIDLKFTQTLGRVFRGGYIRWVLVAYVLYSFTWQGFFTFFPAFLQTEKQLTPEIGGILYALLFVVAGVVGPLSGAISDRFSRVSVAVATLVIAVIGITGLLTFSSFGVLVVFTIIAAVGLRGYPPVMQAHVLSHLPDSNVGGDFGIIKSTYTGIGSLGPIYVGYVANNLGYTEAFWGLASCVLAGGIILFLITFSRG